MVLKLPKIVHFLQICVDLNKRSKSTKATYLHPSERPHHAILKDDRRVLNDGGSLLNADGSVLNRDGSV